MATPPLTNTRGVILTVGILCNSERAEVVMPLSTEDPGILPANKNIDAVAAFIAPGSGLAELLDLMSADAQVTFVQSVGMTPGSVPFRQDYTAGTYPGTRASLALPMQVAIAVAFYANPLDLGPGGRMRVGKTMVPGVADADVVGNTVVAGLISKMQTFGDLMNNGYVTVAGGGNWYRVVAAVGPANGLPLLRSTMIQARGYLVTQRRRLLPH